MTEPSKNSSLARARDAKQDEFYTQLADIEKELKHYRHHFKDKVVYCNCDDPRVSGFFHYFSHNFEKLGLKKLITTCYKSSERDLFSSNDSEHAIMLEYSGDKSGNNVPDVDEIGIVHLKSDGDFRSEESVALLKEADIVVTNPPFSLFREYVMQLVHYEKRFLIIGNSNAITYKELFPLIQNNRMWLGFNNVRWFGRPDGTLYEAARSFWYTNLDHAKRHDELILFRNFKQDEYRRYDNYDAIDVSKSKNIPCDYDGVMGVPITFLEKHNPQQFEIVGIAKTWFGAACKTYPKQIQVDRNGNRREVSKLNDQPAIKVDSPPSDKTYYIVDESYYEATYVRILIRRKV